MLPEGSVRCQDVWKRFRSDRGRPRVRDEIERLRNRLRRRSGPGWRWAIRDVNLALEPGESVGLVGTNGSGKSTLLKLISQVMYPYAGKVDVSGRLGALIEVASGIHPELTGRENIYLFGSLLGLPRRRVAARFEEVVAFAEVENAIDRQVKFYSSGMKMRLGFAVAAFLEPDILLVDEALAVGDANFQQKCLDRMRTVLGQGTTLVFVSHDLAAVQATCNRGVWIDSGVVRADAPIADALGAYRRFIEEAAEDAADVAPAGDRLVKVLKVEVTGQQGGPIRTQGRLEVRVVLETDQERSGGLHLGVSEGTSTPIFSVRRDLYLSPGETELRCSMTNLPLPRGRYYLWAGLFHRNERDVLNWHPATRFEVEGPVLDDAPPAIIRLAPIHVPVEWAVEKR